MHIWHNFKTQYSHIFYLFKLICGQWWMWAGGITHIVFYFFNLKSYQTVQLKTWKLYQRWKMSKKIYLYTSRFCSVFAWLPKFVLVRITHFLFVCLFRSDWSTSLRALLKKQNWETVKVEQDFNGHMSSVSHMLTAVKKNPYSHSCSNSHSCVSTLPIFLLLNNTVV